MLAIMSPLDTTVKESDNMVLNRSLKANMAVKIEVEKSDLPAGILQLLNLGQEAIRGRSEQPPVILLKTADLIFDDQQPKQLEIQMARSSPQGSVVISTMQK